MEEPIPLLRVDLSSTDSPEVASRQNPALYYNSNTSLLVAWPASDRWNIADGSLVRNYGDWTFIAETSAAGVHTTHQVQLSEFIQGITGCAASVDAWERAHDAASGREFYYNRCTNETRWEQPSWEQTPVRYEDTYVFEDRFDEGELDSLLGDVAPVLAVELPRDGVT